MASKIKDVASSLGLFLVFGLLAGALLDNPAVGVLAGLLCHLIVRGLYHGNLSDEA